MWACGTTEREDKVFPGRYPGRSSRTDLTTEKLAGWPTRLYDDSSVCPSWFWEPAHAQQVGSRVPEAADAGASQPASPGQVDQATESAADDSTSSAPPTDIVDRFFSIFSQKEDPDGPINTDRPTFTPANTVVPPGRLQFESGFTYTHQQSGKTSNTSTTSRSSPCGMGSLTGSNSACFGKGPRSPRPRQSCAAAAG